MGAYAYPITINRKRKRINTQRRVPKPESLTKAWIVENCADDECFEVENGAYYGSGDVETEPCVTFFGSRLETNEEYQKRIAREEAYMVEYNRRKNKIPS